MSCSSRSRAARLLAALIAAFLGQISAAGSTVAAQKHSPSGEPVEIEARIPSADEWLSQLGVVVELEGKVWRFEGSDESVPLPLPRQLVMPFEVALPNHSCFAFLASESVLVTAAHCLPVPPLNPVRIKFSGGSGEEVDSDAVCVVQELSPGSWFGSNCLEKQKHDRALCYLKDYAKLAGKVTPLPIAEGGSGQVDLRYRGLMATVSAAELPAACFATQTKSCFGWSGSVTHVKVGLGAYAGVAVLSYGADCSLAPNNTEARFSSVMDGGFSKLLGELENAVEKAFSIKTTLTADRVKLP